MSESENTSKTQADIAIFYLALGQAVHEMPMPFEVHFQAGGTVLLRYRTVEDVDAAVAYVGGRAGHDDHAHQDEHRTWHSYGSRHGGGQVADWSGWPVEVWAAVDGPPPKKAIES